MTDDLPIIIRHQSPIPTPACWLRVRVAPPCNNQHSTATLIRLHANMWLTGLAYGTVQPQYTEQYIYGIPNNNIYQV